MSIGICIVIIRFGRFINGQARKICPQKNIIGFLCDCRCCAVLSIDLLQGQCSVVNTSDRNFTVKGSAVVGTASYSECYAAGCNGCISVSASDQFTITVDLDRTFIICCNNLMPFSYPVCRFYCCYRIPAIIIVSKELQILVACLSLMQLVITFCHQDFI